MLKTPICDLLQIKYPVFQGGMAWVADGRLAAACSNGGGLGIIAAGNAPASAVQEEIRIARGLTDKPFGVNVMLMSPFADEVAAMLSKERVAVITTGAGNPGKYMASWKQAGIRVIPIVPSVAMAKLMERLGADAVIAEGGESGGHIGELNTMVLLPLILDATTLPVIAAGGIADGRGAAAAFVMGASGIQMGTRFLSARECSIHPTYKERVIKAGDRCTMVTGRRLGHPLRALRTPFVREYAKVEYTDISDEDLEAMGVGTLRAAVQDGDLEKGTFLCGQSAALVKKEQPAAEIISEIMEETEEILKGATKWIE